MTNTLNNVPRELLEAALSHPKTPEKMLSKIKAAEELRAILSAPSPAGVDGLEVVAYLIGGEPSLKQCAVRGVVNDPLCRLSDAQAIIDGLRGELRSLEEYAAGRMNKMRDLRQQRDQFAGLLRESHGKYKTGIPYSLGERIAAAMSSGKEVD